MAHPVTWFQITGRDDRALVDFYERLFGWRMQSSPGEVGYHMVAPEAGGIAGGIGAARDGNASVSVYVDVDDLEQYLKKIEAAGGKTALAPMDLPQGMGRIAGFYDPAGNWIGLWEPGKPAAAPRPAKRAAKQKSAPRPAKKRAAKKKKSAPRPAKKRAAKKKSARRRAKKSAPRTVKRAAKKKTAPRPAKRAAKKKTAVRKKRR